MRNRNVAGRRAEPRRPPPCAGPLPSVSDGSHGSAPSTTPTICLVRHPAPSPVFPRPKKATGSSGRQTSAVMPRPPLSCSGEHSLHRPPSRPLAERRPSSPALRWPRAGLCRRCAATIHQN
ncbi:hypothetical protein BRADI_2g44515v3 [Brachypodium distachyon]|uniref:Uncharacterized protein n=1 Tax=Brachypodium distachyon TaxID=15368 RepID=A0A2K2DDT9_BRADI|nr:hypothetical protein BRADI_2g44515v3 [Brachypodium distachyon]